MSESAGEKTEAPTPKRRQDAREEGKIPRSQELNTAVLLLASAAVLGYAGPALGRALFSLFGSGLAAIGRDPMDTRGVVVHLQQMGGQVIVATLPILLMMSAVALATGAAQGRGVVTTKPLAPKWERLDPVTNGKRMLGAQPWVELLKSLLKLVIVGIAVHVALSAAWSDVLALAQQGPAAIGEVVLRYSRKLLLTAGGAYLALAAADYLYQIWSHERSLRMSHQDIKQESKQSEGDPLLKARMRSMGRARVRQQMFAQVPLADVVITNPTHIAVALKYDPEKAPAPVVIAMGQRKVAERIKKIARDHDVATVENKPLARALLASAQVGTMIPADLYVAVAEVLAFVIRERAGSYGGSR